MLDRVLGPGMEPEQSPGCKEASLRSDEAGLQKSRIWGCRGVEGLPKGPAEKEGEV